MGFWEFRGRKQTQLPSRKENQDRGILVFANTSEVIRAENLLRGKGWKIRLMGPPPQITSGCDLVIEIPLIEMLNIRKMLEEARIRPLQAVPVTDPLHQPVDLFQIKDYGRYLMVRAANMKLTVDKETLIIANVSGGGCPDVPYLGRKDGGPNRILLAIGDMPVRPVLIADAGFMYAAKMSGQSPEYDLFTPDVGELAFLADEAAPHPFYTRGFILHDEHRIPDLIARAYAHENAPRYLLVKGKIDYLANREGIQTTIQEPSMEAIGGTGDTLTGIVAALIAAGKEVSEAAISAAQANRWAGFYANPTPGTSVREIIRHIPPALEKILQSRETSRFSDPAYPGRPEDFILEKSPVVGEMIAIFWASGNHRLGGSDQAYKVANKVLSKAMS